MKVHGRACKYCLTFPGARGTSFYDESSLSARMRHETRPDLAFTLSRPLAADTVRRESRFPRKGNWVDSSCHEP